MKRLRLSAAITAVLGLVSIPSVVYLYFEFLDLSEKTIRHVRINHILTIASLVVLGIFIISTFITLGYFLKTSHKLLNLTVDSDNL
jgi:uncharacterized membrane protein (UPF0182 family)